MFTHFFKIYNSYKGANSHSKQNKQAQNGAIARNFLTRCTQNPHNEQFSKQERYARSLPASWEQTDKAEKGENPQHIRAERAECEADTKAFLSDVYKMSTRARKRQVDATQYGRSMVEMLGVLAIIGVLSVGGIAGYSKAMMKYKLNKFSVAMNELLNTSIQYKGKLYSSSNYTDPDGAQWLAQIFYKMNALPDGIKYHDRQYLKDMFGNSVWPHAYPNPKSTTPFSALGYALSYNGDSKLSNEICHQLINIAKENYSQLWYIFTSNTNQEGSSLSTYWYGSSYCDTNKKCISNISISDIDTLCHACSSESLCRFYFTWK